MDTNKTHQEKARLLQLKNTANCLKQFLIATPYKTAAVRSPATYLTNYSIIGRLVPLFNVVSVFMDYSMPDPFLYKNSSDTI